MSIIKVIQAVNTSNYDQIGGLSCIKYWENNTPNRHDSISYCRATRSYITEDDQLVGAHVIGIVDDVPHVYITAIKDSVNKSNDPEIFDVDMADLVAVPTDHEQKILEDKDNQDLLKKLSLLMRMKDMTGYSKSK